MSTAKTNMQSQICVHLVKRAFDRAFKAVSIAEKRYPDVFLEVSVAREIDDSELSSMECLDESKPFIRVIGQGEFDCGDTLLGYRETLRQMIRSIESLAVHCRCGAVLSVEYPKETP